MTSDPKPPPEVQKEKKGIAALLVVALVAIGKGGAFVIAHIALLFKPAVATGFVDDAAQAAIHAAPAIAHAAPEMTDDAAKAIIHSKLVEDAAKGVGSASHEMGDGERIIRSAGNVAKN